MARLSKVISQVLGWRTVIAFVLYVLPISLLVKLVTEVRDHETLQVDDRILKYINSHASHSLDVLAILVTELGSPIAVAAMSLGVAAILVSKRAYRAVAIFSAGVGGAVILSVVLKVLFRRDRPELWERLVTESSYSFPSGHAMATAAFYFSLVIVTWNTKWRWWVIVGGAGYVAMVGLSRLYLGVHYPTDVLAGWLFAGVWVSMVYVLSTPATQQLLRRPFAKRT
jgi:membrane-associated phospholipid phosphatase